MNLSDWPLGEKGKAAYSRLPGAHDCRPNALPKSILMRPEENAFLPLAVKQALFHRGTLMAAYSPLSRSVPAVKTSHAVLQPILVNTPTLRH
jgi:hypothetical protein